MSCILSLSCFWRSGSFCNAALTAGFFFLRALLGRWRSWRRCERRKDRVVVRGVRHGRRAVEHVS